MAATRRKLLQNALMRQRNDRQHENDKVERRGIRLQLHDAMAETARALEAVDAPFAVIPGADAVMYRGH